MGEDTTIYPFKPGRGPSIMGVLGSVIAVIIGIAWTGSAISIGAPPVFGLLIILFVVAAIVGGIYNFINATSRDRMSIMDITTDKEEGDPVEHALGFDRRGEISGSRDGCSNQPRKFEGEFCPFCGARVRDDFDYCPKCGKDI